MYFESEGNPVSKFVWFICKSQLYRCSDKKSTDDGSDKQQEMLVNVTHHHLVFTIPFGLQEELKIVWFKCLDGHGADGIRSISLVNLVWIKVIGI